MSARLSIPAYAASKGVSKVAAYKWRDRNWLVLVDGLVDVAASDIKLAQYRDTSDARSTRPKPAKAPKPPPAPALPPLPPMPAPVPPLDDRADRALKAITDALAKPAKPTAPPIAQALAALVATAPVPTPPVRPASFASDNALESTQADADYVAAQLQALQAGNASTEEARRVKENYVALQERLKYEQAAGSLVDLAKAEGVLFEAARALRNTWLGFPSKFGPLIAADLGLEADLVTGVLTGYIHKQVAALGEPNGQFAD